jgi:shikimate kinase/3-dehydroquinate synthase
MTAIMSRLAVSHPGGHYDVLIGTELLPELRTLTGIAGPVALVTDSNVGPLYAEQCPPADCVITIPAGEQHKTLATVNRIYDELLEAGIDRGGTVFALGGGVVGDVAGFAAATFMRGVGLVQVPTTLLAMVDASVGGKTGVDKPQGKNLVGAFKQPVAVLADLSTLQTLPSVELACGLAEVVKHGLIAVPEIIRDLEAGEGHTSPQRTFGRLAPMVATAIGVKRDIVQEDPFEQERRAVLNLGHTFAHAIEQTTQYRIRHGQAVAIGLVAAADLSATLNHCSLDLVGRVESLLVRLGLPVRIPDGITSDELLKAMRTDKKRWAGVLRFILLREIGDVFISEDVPETAVRETLGRLSQEMG